MTPLTTISTALYVCEGCDDAGNEGNCYHADQLRHTPTHQWLCQTCYDAAKADDDSGEPWPAWDDLMRHPCMAAELIEARLAIAHMHDIIAMRGPERPAPAMRVRPLAWRNATPNVLVSDDYEIWSEGCRHRLLHSWTGQGEHYNSLIDAQNAAQADYEARILAALEGL